MSTMLARSATERAALRAAADERGSWSPLLAVTCGAVLATLDWLDGTRRVGPVSSSRREGPAGTPPTDGELAREELAAGDAETLARGARADNTWPGVVGQTLAWCRCDPSTEAPLL